MGGSGSRPGRKSRRLVWGAAAGAICFLILHAVFVATWNRWFTPADLDQPWFLASRRSLMVTQAAFALLATWIGRRPATGWGERLARAGSVAAGAVAALAGAFLTIGPDRLLLGPTGLWPAALLSAAVLLAAPILAGTLIGGILGRHP